MGDVVYIVTAAVSCLGVLIGSFVLRVNTSRFLCDMEVSGVVLGVGAATAAVVHFMAS